MKLYPAFKDEKFIGAAVIGYSDRGYSGLVKLMLVSMTMVPLKILPYWNRRRLQVLGTKMKNESFISQFRGKHPSSYNLRVTKDGGDVDCP